MDLNTIEIFERPGNPGDLGAYRSGDAWVGGGTWLFSEPQPDLRRLIATDGFGWVPLEVSPAGLRVAATCRIVELDGFDAPVDWPAAALFGECCRAFLASFKIWNMATVGGNLCMSLPAGPMISLCAALDGVCEILGRDGSLRRMPVLDFVKGPQQNALRPGDLLRAVVLPADALRRRAAFRRAALAPMGRSGVLVIATADDAGHLSLTVTAATPRPLRLEFASFPEAAEMLARLETELPPEAYYDDVHGRPDWRRHMTREFALEVLADLRGQGA